MKPLQPLQGDLKLLSSMATIGLFVDDVDITFPFGFDVSFNVVECKWLMLLKLLQYCNVYVVVKNVS